jgi:hypothetical protein
VQQGWNHWTGPLAAFVLGALAFGLTYCQAPLYYSNQNQYFLHGLADAGVGFLDEDWLANTTDPTPLFSFLVSITWSYLHEYAFHVYYLVLFGVYFAALMGLFAHLAGECNTLRARLGFAALLLLVHSALVRWGSYRLFGWDYPWYFQAGLAGQYVLGAMFQPSTFGVLLILSVSLFVRGKPFWAVTSLGLAAAMHSTYLLGAGILTLAYLLVRWREARLGQDTVLARQRCSPLPSPPSTGERGGKTWLRMCGAAAPGAWALLLVLPGLTYALVAFRPSAPDAFTESQHLLAHVRIPHHCLPELWCDGIALGQTAWMLLALWLVRGTRLLPILGVTFVVSLGLTLLQVATGSDTLALLFPWRASAILVPIATTVILSRLVIAGARWFDRNPVAVGSALLITGLVGAGLAITWLRQGFQTSDEELPLLNHVRTTKTRGDVYLLPAPIPNLAATTRGSLSSDFKPLAAKKTDVRIIPIDLQRFRLFTGAPIFVDFKAIPYKDTDVLEWYDRLRFNQTVHQRLATGNLDDLRGELRRRGITHVVLPAKVEQAGSVLVGIYRVYRMPR